MKCSILFGAGAEQPFGLPQGAEYALKSIFIKDDKLLNAVKEYFNLDKQYRLFNRKDSLLFRNCIFLTVKYIQTNNENLFNNCKLYKYVLNEKKQIASELEDLSEESKTNISYLYDEIIKINDFKKVLTNEPINDISAICQNLLYKGNIEKDFYCLIDRNKYGDKGYYKLFYYFWSCYFSIIKPIIEKTKYFKDKNDNIYLEIFKNLEDITKFVFSEEILDYYKDNSNYYDAFKSIDENIEGVLTTNYTPFIDLYYKNKSYYLSGDLKTFEISEENEIFELPKNVENKKFFPFMMTQAPVKPIIYTQQIEAYYLAINSLKSSNYLIVVGYSLCDNDNHILALIKEFMKKDDNKIIYCSYENSSENIDEKTYKAKKKEELKQILHLKDSSNIIVLINDGNAKKLVEKIKKQ